VLSTSPQAGLLSGVVSSNPREIAIQTLIRDPNNSGFVESLLNKNLELSRLSAKDRSLTRELTLGTARWRLTLEWLAQRKLRVQPPETVLLLICLGLYQLFWMRVPQHAAVFETVELCRIFDIERYKTLINAILRGYSREIDATRQLLEDMSAGRISGVRKAPLSSWIGITPFPSLTSGPIL
jgi:16S rRNA (cytosine967-C5)-methyltransferase